MVHNAVGSRLRALSDGHPAKTLTTVATTSLLIMASRVRFTKFTFPQQKLEIQNTQQRRIGFLGT